MSARPPVDDRTGVTVDIVIDEIVLRGIPAEHGPVVVEAFRQRLGELVSAANADALVALRDRAEASRRLEPIAVDGVEASRLGRSVAESLWGAMVLAERGGP